jgi:hypothetical protein
MENDFWDSCGSARRWDRRSWVVATSRRWTRERLRLWWGGRTGEAANARGTRPWERRGEMLRRGNGNGNGNGNENRNGRTRNGSLPLANLISSRDSG